MAIPLNGYCQESCWVAALCRLRTLFNQGVLNTGATVGNHIEWRQRSRHGTAYGTALHRLSKRLSHSALKSATPNNYDANELT